MKKRDYQTITGRTLELSGLGDEERKFLGTVQRKYTREPEWSEFAAWWERNGSFLFSSIRFQGERAQQETQRSLFTAPRLTRRSRASGNGCTR